MYSPFKFDTNRNCRFWNNFNFWVTYSHFTNFSLSVAEWTGGLCISIYNHNKHSAQQNRIWSVTWLSIRNLFQSFHYNGQAFNCILLIESLQNKWQLTGSVLSNWMIERNYNQPNTFVVVLLLIRNLIENKWQQFS